MAKKILYNHRLIWILTFITQPSFCYTGIFDLQIELFIYFFNVFFFFSVGVGSLMVNCTENEIDEPGSNSGWDIFVYFLLLLLGKSWLQFSLMGKFRLVKKFSMGVGLIIQTPIKVHFLLKLYLYPLLWCDPILNKASTEVNLFLFYNST